MSAWIFSLTQPWKYAVGTLLAIIVLDAGAGSADAGTLYSNNFFEKQIAALSIGTDGLLTPLSGSPFVVSTHETSGLAITPDGRTVLTAFSSDQLIGTRALAPNGSVSLLGPEQKGDVTTLPAITPDGRFAYAGSQSGGVLAYALGPGGALTSIGGLTTSGIGEDVAITPNGRFLYLPTFSPGEIEGFAINPNGSLSPLGKTEVSGGSPKGMQVTPDGRFAVVDNETGANARIRSYTIGSDGSLTEIGAFLKAAGASVAGPVISPNGRFVYVANFNEQSISAYAIAADGKLSEIGPPTPSGISGPEAIAMSDDGHFLYVQPEDGGEFQAFSVAANGSLAKLGEAVSTGGGSDHTTPLPRPAVPTATLSAGPAVPGKTTALDASGSSDAGANITAFGWDFGDGSRETTTVPQTTHIYRKAGVYHATVTLSDDVGCVGFIYTGQSPYCNASGATASIKLDTLPVLSALRAKVKKGRVTFDYILSEKARVAFTLQRRTGKQLRTIGRFEAEGEAGPNRSALPRRLKGRRLGPGRYLASAIAIDSGGQHSGARSLHFRLKPAARR